MIVKIKDDPIWKRGKMDLHNFSEILQDDYSRDGRQI